MRFALTLSLLALAPVGFAAALMAQNGSAQDGQEQALRDAKLKAVRAERRSEMLRQEASNAASAADRIVAQRAVLSAEIAAAEAQIEAANARIAIISRRQRAQQKLLGQQSEPILRLNAALQQMTGRPTALMMAQPGHREDYIHVRAVMATVQPQIVARTNALRQQIASQNELRAQELLALQTLGDARSRLTNRRAALARLEGSTRGKADDFAANAAIEFERAIAQGERARDIVGRIDTERLGSVTAAELAALSGPALRLADDRQVEAKAGAYILPVQGKLVSGFNELNATGYRERGVRLSAAPGARVVAPAAGKVSFAGRYRSYGQIVILEHGKGWNSLITHLGNVRVARGDLVRQGSPLGEAGRETSEIGVELRKNGRVMDIAALLR
ncbi:murein hydrolase activator EnvC family protein [Sphingorhabdus contaminans]|uniref:Peptidoglycan DD-metalloendopeptidase family protein n=1 Tax=Sphingorhabdus contaminans TaxID=1343899 RepID=A0A553WAK0_9SPHN|nr:peptidoglycan DD-metalloendopeptidase family protein [Sphingorhabdus contaminans]TSB01725.1 peptidoglycan DD-metalloendopeptidase family protein [Sphingorhabdus contaminans]